MDSVNTSEVNRDGGRHEILIGMDYQDPDEPDYRHSFVWWFTPDLSTGAPDAVLLPSAYVHKKYWRKLDDVKHGRFTQDDGSEIIDSIGHMGDNINASSIPEPVKETFASVFGSPLATRTFRRTDGVDTGPSSYPDNATGRVFTFDVALDGSYTEDLPDDDPRAGTERFRNQMKDKHGEVTHTWYRVNHSCSWWFEPVPATGSDNARLRIKKCYHKTWDDTMQVGFSEDYEGETLVTARESHESTPAISELPEPVQAELADWFGRELVERSIGYSGGELPKYVFKCFECDALCMATSLSTCPDCGENALCKYESVEQYEQQSERQTNIAEHLATADMKLTMDTPSE